MMRSVSCIAASRVAQTTLKLAATAAPLAAQRFAAMDSAGSKSADMQQHPRVILTSERESIAPDLLRYEASFHHLMMRDVARHPADKVAFKCAASGQTVKYGEIAGLVRRYANVLYHKYGVRSGDRVLLMCPNTPTYVAYFHAILSLGAVVSPVNSLATPSEIARQARIAGATVLFAHDAFKPALQGSVEVEPLKVCYASVNTDGVDPVPESALAPEFAGPQDTIVLPFSSGTTGLPKGVQLTNRNLVANLLQTQVCCEFGEDDVMLAVLPYFHIYGLTVKLHGILHEGGTQITFPKFDMESYLDAIQREKATHCFVAPPIMVGFAKHPKTKLIDTNSVRTIMCGAAPLGADVQRMCEPLFKHASIGQGYGLTETSPVLTITLENGVYGRAGTLASDTEARIVVEDSTAADGFRDVLQGEEGELWVRGPQVMKGYLEAADTAQVLVADDDENAAKLGPWFRTGDIGFFDSLKQLAITDRLKELIKYKGSQVAPAELEALLLTHEAVADAIVVGIPAGDDCGEVPRAHVVLQAGATPSPELANAIKEHIKSRAAPTKWLRGGVKFVDAIPKTASGKLLRRVVREQERQAARKAEE